MASNHWQLPNLVGQELPYLFAEHLHACTGRDTVDASIGGNLVVFRTADYYGVFR
jgi:hypothetical protein